MKKNEYSSKVFHLTLTPEELKQIKEEALTLWNGKESRFLKHIIMEYFKNK